MAAYTSTQTGNWSSPSTWGGSGPPGNGDTATIATGHVVTVTANTTVGTSPPSSPSGVVFINGQLIINQGVTLTLLGTLAMSGTTGSNGVVTNSGNIVLDTSVGNFNYAIAIGQQHSTTAKLVCPGTISNRPTVSSTGSFYGRIIDSGWIGGGRVEADYTDFSKLGYPTGSVSSISFYISSSTDNLYLRNCTFDDCGPVKTAVAAQAPAKLIIQNCVWTNSNQFPCLYISSVAPTGGGVRTVDNNRFDKIVHFYAGTGCAVTNNYFRFGYEMLTPYTFASNEYNLISPRNSTSEDSVNGPTTLSKAYCFSHYNVANVHPLNCPSSANNTHQDLVFDYPYGGGGDFLIGGTSGLTFAISGCLTLPNRLNASAGVFANALSGSGKWRLNRNTVCATKGTSANAEDFVFKYGETTPGTSGLIEEFQDNLIFSPTGIGAGFVRANQNFVDDPVDVAGVVRNNAYENPSATVTGGVLAVYGTVGGYLDLSPGTVAVRVVSGTTGSFTLLCYHSNGVTTAETGTIAYNAAGATVATAIQTALNTLSDGTYAVTYGSGTTVDSSTGVNFTVTRNAIALTQSQRWDLLRQGGTNTTGGTVYTTREMFTTPPANLGQNDLVAAPNFVDSTRNMATFDTAYLGNTASQGTWTTATGYSVGDIVSSTDSAFYGSAVVNFRCILAHTSNSGHATNGKPGASTTTAWQTNWELASTWRIRTNAVSYNASVRQPTPRDLIEWVRAGFCTQNSALATAGHDGGVIGIGYTAAASGYTYMSNGGEGPVFNYLEC